MLPGMRVIGRGGAWRHVEDAHGERRRTILCRDHLADLHAIGQSLIPRRRDILIGFDDHISSLPRLSLECDHTQRKSASDFIRMQHGVPGTISQRVAQLPPYVMMEQGRRGDVECGNGSEAA
jgi:hypothetical protein